MWKTIKRALGRLGLQRWLGTADTLASTVKTLSGQTLQAMVAEVHAGRLILEKAGYLLRRVEVQVGLSPRVVVTVSRTARANDRALATLLQRRPDPALAALLGALRQAIQLQGQVRLTGLVPAEIEVELGLSPAIRLGFTTQPSSPAAQPEEVDEETDSSPDTQATGETQIRFPCPGCGKNLRCPPGNAGRQGRCRKCGVTFTAPESEGFYSLAG